MKKKLIMSVGMLVVFLLVVWILSIAKEKTVIVVVGEFILFICKGIENVLFTPYTLVAIVIAAIIIKPNLIKGLVEWLREVFETLPGGFKFKDEKVENLTRLEEIGKLDSSNEHTGREGVNFYKRLLTCTGAMSTIRFMAYAIDQPGRPSNFSDIDLAKWTYGEKTVSEVNASDIKQAILLMAPILIQTEIIKGQVSIDNNQMQFIGAFVNPKAHVALEQLSREGWQMTPQVTINR